MYHKYREEKCKPFLLESLGPQTPYSSRCVLGVRPSRILICRNGRLFENELDIGPALSIFEHFELPRTNSFFPAWLGFFSYEFARHCGLPTRPLKGNFPEAAFFLYEDGHVWDSAQVREIGPHAALPMPHKNLGAVENLRAGFKDVANSISNGDVYQVNLAQRFDFDARSLDFLHIYERLRVNNPSPFMGLIEDDTWAIASASPERLFSLRDGVISTRPIAGTRKRGLTQAEDEVLEQELLSSTKERAEHAMLVDLARNDLARVCETGSVHVDEAYIVERYSHVMHLVSEVSGKTSRSLREIFASLFPAGTITGTPKESAMEHIRDLELNARGPYTGSMGYISSGEGVDFNILIRSAFRDQERGYIWAGAGIVAQSEAGFEQGEVVAKARSVTNVLSNDKSPSTPALPRPGVRVDRTHFEQKLNQRVLFVENHDSFSHNIVDALRTLGCEVTVVDHNDAPDLAGHKHILLGPGPRQPKEAGQLMSWLEAAYKNNCGVLGICLGHQAIGQFFGAEIVRARRAIHGECESLTHLEHPLFRRIPSDFRAMRYHSLVIRQVPECLKVIAYSKSDEVMAIAHQDAPIFGVQFHPESFLSEGGFQLFTNFLEMT